MQAIMEGSAVSRTASGSIALRIVDGTTAVTVFLTDEAAREVREGIDAIITE
jgi:hypothetical protein